MKLIEHFRLPLLAFIALSLILLLHACSSEVPPRGGPPDTDPPELRSSSPENYSLNFTGNTIKLNFDKYIELQNVLEELVVSPPLEEPPEVSHVRRSMRIELNEKLRENTTYTFRFGDAIRDFREGNILSDFQFVISTGSYIDSAYIDGQVRHAFNNEPAKGVKVLIYDKLEDSIVFKERPLYYSRTNDNGNFSLENLSPGKYRIYALKDEQGTYKYDPGDAFAFYDDTLVLEDSLINIEMRMYEEELRPMRLIDLKKIHRGKSAFLFNRRSEDLTINFGSSAGKRSTTYHRWHAEEDSLTVWHHPANHDTASFIFAEHSTPFDTAGIAYTEEDTFPDKTSFVFDAPASITMHDPLIFRSPDPLMANHPEKIHVLEDSIKDMKPEFDFHKEGHAALLMDFQRRHGRNYVIYLEEGAVCDIYNRCNDSLYLELQTREQEAFGAVEVNLQDNVPYPVIVQLVKQDGEEVVRQRILDGDKTIWFRNIPPGRYRIKGVEDRDESGTWTTGEFLKGRQPERVFYHEEVLHIRANWEIRDITLIAGDEADAS